MRAVKRLFDKHNGVPARAGLFTLFEERGYSRNKMEFGRVAVGNVCFAAERL